MACYSCGSEEGSVARLCPACIQARQAEREARHGDHSTTTAGARTKLPLKEQILKQLFTPGPPLVIALISIFVVMPLSAFILTSILGSVSSGGSSASLEEKVKEFIRAENQAGCNGVSTVTSLTISGVGPVNPALGAAPVTGGFSVQCVDGESVRTKNNSNQSATIAYVRKSYLGGEEVFQPQIIKEMSAQFTRDMQDSFKKGFEHFGDNLNSR